MPDLTSPQSFSLVLSLFGIVFLFACLILIALKRVPELKSPQQIKGLGLDLNISLITLLVLVGLVLSLSSTYLQIKNYDQELQEIARKRDTLESQLARAGKVSVNAVITFEGVARPEEMPSLQDVYAKYYLKGPNGEGWIEPAKITRAIYPLDFYLTIEDINPGSSIERIEVFDRKDPSGRKWELDRVGTLLSPKFILKKTD